MRMLSLIIISFLLGCSVDVNLKQKNPIVIKTESTGQIGAKVEVTVQMDVASQIEKLCGKLEGETYMECSDRVLSIYINLTKLVELIKQKEG